MEVDMIRVLITYYNARKYIEKCIKSIQNQMVQDFKVYIMDDLSTDRSSNYVQNLVKDDSRFEYILNKKKMYQSGNYWKILQKKEIDDNDICVTVDGDDWLSSNQVFERVLEYYEDGNTWMTFGQYLIYHNQKNIEMGRSKKPIPFDDARYLAWTSSHLRTFKAFLFRQLDKKDLCYDNEHFYPHAGDKVCFCPMMEMAGESRVKYVDDLNYIYNDETPLNDSKVNLKSQYIITDIISKKPKYVRL